MGNTMAIADLIKVLEKIEDKTIEIGFTYDSRCGSNLAHMIDIETWRGNKNVLVFREDDVADLEFFGLDHYYNDIKENNTKPVYIEISEE